MAAAKTYTTTELALHNSKDNLFLSINGKVYDVSGFIDEHPGGEEVLIDEAGHDATESFEDVGHSEEARDIMKRFYVGELKLEGSEKPKTKPTFATTPKPIPAVEPTDTGSSLQYVIAAVVVAGCVIWKAIS
ncbi:hypothetical protein BGW38_010394 [Lunasporangiospora selenospora]|uniref:Cytochrome b5 heme-binding domain-containing protein n=1 Tax=Lunasporangiospora selenospora TaxID=979761 RepID=A0A9P6FYJ3_9FUNG|nr:hypothetical protein BGW38_010394 [Lunasporangiospora selenospora]